MKRGHSTSEQFAVPKRRLHVVAAVIYNGDDCIFLSRRPSYVDQGGMWEFPGGKLHANETSLEALKRELQEELGIQVHRARPLIKVNHEYSDKRILLDVWEVRDFSGEPYGAEGQVVRWVPHADVARYHFPSANDAVVKAVMMPHALMVTEDEADDARFSERFKASLAEHSPELVRLRASSLSADAYQARVVVAAELAAKAGAKLVIGHHSCDIEALAALVEQHNLAGVQLTETQLLDCSQRVLPAHRWQGASAHSSEALEHAQSIDCDFAVLGTVLPSTSHPDADAMYWNGLQSRLDNINIPVFAIGGMALSDIDRARAIGAQGVAAISAFLPTQ
ncbi:Nudix family hydrolase [Carnimonas bestiolae]|uniref:Nudix family hydrolase n=1 Tax=Carnimonas bestiolae TaxID=3402172 RepID=UPI003EDC4ECB